MKKIGLTTTVPIEVLLAAGYCPVDLNNLFVTDEKYLELMEFAERDGFPKSTCAWIKGIYGACVTKGIDTVVGVMEGDCSNTRSLVEVFALKGVRIYPFSYPQSQQRTAVEQEIQKFMDVFGVQHEEVERVRTRLMQVRQRAKTLDELTYQANKATGFENHLYQVSMSDLNGDAESFCAELERKLEEISARPSVEGGIRLAYLGVPLMPGDLYDFVEGLGARVVYNEVQREFAFPRAEQAVDIVAQYVDYTYPYGMEFRIAEIRKQLAIREIDAVVHYTQAFCHRAIDDIVLREKLALPVLTIEGDRLNCLDARTKLRIEAFIDMLQDIKG